MLKITQDVDYSNFKNAVNRELGMSRVNICHNVWATLMELEND